MRAGLPEGRILVASYNIHRAVGLDRRKDLGRIAAVLEEIGAGIVALQEAEAVTRLGRTSCQIEDLAARLGMTPVHGPTLVHHDGRYGNALLSRHPVVETERLDLSHARREPRGALIVRLGGAASGLNVACTHFGLRAAERQAQLAALLPRLEALPQDQVTLLIGDLNEWLPVSRLLGTLFGHFGPSPRPPTYPSLRPLLSLDRAFVAPRSALASLHAHRSKLASRASDHLPLVAQVDVPR